MNKSENHNIFVPAFSSTEEANYYLRSNPTIWQLFLQLPEWMKQELLSFCIGNSGLKVTYDSVFKKIFNPSEHPERMEELISALIGKKVKIIDVLTKEGSQLTELGSFVVMDALVQLDDGTYANVEMQKIGYTFPLQRVDCYASDIIMRQYVKSKAVLGDKFNFKGLHKVYCIVFMEKSAREFKTIQGKYIHKRTSSFDTGIFITDAGLHEDIFICLDTFRETVHNITKSRNVLEAWLTFISATDINVVSELVVAFPQFVSLYQEIAEFIKKPEELMKMLSEELSIMDRNTERLMVEELQEEVSALRKELEEKDALIARLQECQNREDSK